jgi:hypothetical protein
MKCHGYATDPEEGSNGLELASLASSLNVNRLPDTHATTCQIGTVAGEPEVRRNYGSCRTKTPLSKVVL